MPQFKSILDILALDLTDFSTRTSSDKSLISIIKSFLNLPSCCDLLIVLLSAYYCIK